MELNLYVLTIVTSHPMPGIPRLVVVQALNARHARNLCKQQYGNANWTTWTDPNDVICRKLKKVANPVILFDQYG